MYRREPAFAGRFYPASPDGCRRLISTFDFTVSTGSAVAAVAPHAGWVYSGRIAARSIAALASGRPDTVVVFGAVHVFDRNHASLFPAGRWVLPNGEIEIDAELVAAVQRCRDVVVDPIIHTEEHSIEVELPLLLQVCPTARLCALMVRPGPHAVEIGRWVGRAAADLGRRVAYIASTDLTHYGPAFGFEPAGRGAPGIAWAHGVNDRGFLAAVAAGDPAAIVPEAAAHRNACGAGAVAATLAAAGALGSLRYLEIEHGSSAAVERAAGGDPVNSVGYCAAVLQPR